MASCEIQLSKGGVALVDDADYERIARHRWHRSAFGYAVRFVTEDGKPRVVWMHREVMHAPRGLEVDHINRDRLDNRRSNLRLATHAENSRNTRSKRGVGEVPGVGFHKASGTWRAYIRVNGKQIEKSGFADKAAAVEYRIALAEQHFGEFSPHRIGPHA